MLNNREKILFSGIFLNTTAFVSFYCTFDFDCTKFRNVDDETIREISCVINRFYIYAFDPNYLCGFTKSITLLVLFVFFSELGLIFHLIKRFNGFNKDTPRAKLKKRKKNCFKYRETQYFDWNCFRIINNSFDEIMEIKATLIDAWEIIDVFSFSEQRNLDG